MKLRSDGKATGAATKAEGSAAAPRTSGGFSAAAASRAAAAAPAAAANSSPPRTNSSPPPLPAKAPTPQKVAATDSDQRVCDDESAPRKTASSLTAGVQEVLGRRASEEMDDGDRGMAKQDVETSAATEGMKAKDVALMKQAQAVASLFQDGTVELKELLADQDLLRTSDSAVASHAAAVERSKEGIAESIAANVSAARQRDLQRVEVYERRRAEEHQKIAEQQQQMEFAAALEQAALDRQEQEKKREDEANRAQLAEHRRQLELHELQIQQQKAQRSLIEAGFDGSGRETKTLLHDLHASQSTTVPADPAAYTAYLLAAARTAASNVPPLVAADDAWWGGWSWAAEAQQLAKASPSAVAKLRSDAMAAIQQAEEADVAAKQAEETAQKAANDAEAVAKAEADRVAAQVAAARELAAKAAAAAERLEERAFEAETGLIAASESVAGEDERSRQIRTGSGAAAHTLEEALSSAHKDARALRRRLTDEAWLEQRLRVESASRLLASIAPSSAAAAAAAALAEAETKANLAQQAAAVGADMVAERRQREAAEALENAEVLAKRAAQSVGRILVGADEPTVPPETATGGGPGAPSLGASSQAASEAWEASISSPTPDLRSILMSEQTTFLELHDGEDVAPDATPPAPARQPSGFSTVSSESDSQKPGVGRLRRTPINRQKRGKAREGTAAGSTDCATDAAQQTPKAATGVVESAKLASSAPATGLGKISTGGGWDLTAMRRSGTRPSDPFWEGDAPSPLEPLRLGRSASPSKRSLAFESDHAMLRPAPLTSSLSVVKSVAAATAGPEQSAAAVAEIDLRADTALERSRARASEAKARLASSPLRDSVPGSAAASVKPWKPAGSFDTSPTSLPSYLEHLLVPFTHAAVSTPKRAF